MLLPILAICAKIMLLLSSASDRYVDMTALCIMTPLGTHAITRSAMSDRHLLNILPMSTVFNFISSFVKSLFKSLLMYC